MIGTTQLHYRIQAKIGEGGMGVVYRATDTKLMRTVAIKFLPRHVAANADERERFKTEARAAAALNHPNIATIHAIEEAGDEMFLVMEYIDGQELGDLLKAPRHTRSDDGAVDSHHDDGNAHGNSSEHATPDTPGQPLRGSSPDLDLMLDYAAQIASGLQAAHEQGITHRDIKSANIMITSKGQAKIMDFGLAKVRGGAQVTKAGTTLGTAAYMSPEQARGEEVDQRSDIWSFGVVLYEMLAGRLPFGGDYEQAVIYAILNEDPEPIEDPRLPEELQEILQRALAKDPAERYQSIGELLPALRELGSGGANPVDRSRPKSRVRRFRPWQVAVPAVALVVLVAGAMYFNRSTAAPIDTLAILPLVNQNEDKEMEYLSDGISETLIFRLSRLPDLKVRSLSSVLRYKGAAADPVRVGEDLRVRAVLTGRVALRNDRLAIVVELVDTQDNTTIWGETYNRTVADLITVHDEISASILRHLKFELTGEALAKVDEHQTENTEAYQAFLKGRYFLQNRSAQNLRNAIDYFQQAIDLEPGYAIAWAGIAETWLLMQVYGNMSRDEALPNAKRAAQKALELDDSLSESHFVTALILQIESWDFAGAEQAYKRALELNPNNTAARHHYSYMLLNLLRFDEALTEAKICLDLEPMSALMTRGVALVYYFSRQYDQAMKYYQDCLELNPNSMSTLFHQAQLFYHLGDPNQSIDLLVRYHQLLSEDTLASRLQKTFDRDGYRAALIELLSDSNAGFLADEAQKGYLYAMIGEPERAIQSLTRAVEQKTALITWVSVYPTMDDLRSDPRYIAIQKKVFGGSD